ncbi:unnamed protein product [Cuscuta campestris]|uniref:Uncharacterized protein n=1 Tax=Cuscuta campestris TaxID=132261 RepID=A0A484KMA3_9ASTE|nr:unnamed protein product [Cuscuta campestris]
MVMRTHISKTARKFLGTIRLFMVEQKALECLILRKEKKSSLPLIPLLPQLLSTSSARRSPKLAGGTKASYSVPASAEIGIPTLILVSTIADSPSAVVNAVVITVAVRWMMVTGSIIAVPIPLFSWLGSVLSIVNSPSLLAQFCSGVDCTIDFKSSPLLMILDVRKEPPNLKDIPSVRDFPDMFPDELPEFEGRRRSEQQRRRDSSSTLGVSCPCPDHRFAR